MPEKQNNTRRAALKTFAGLIICGGTSVGLVHYAVRREASADETVRLGAVSDYPIGQFQKRTVTVTEHGTWLTGPVEKTLWIRRNADDTFLVFSGTCPHMNCTINEAPGQTFACPCHQSGFDSEGRVTAGPSPRPLDTLEYRVSSSDADGQLSVQFQNYKKGLPNKELVPLG